MSSNNKYESREEDPDPPPDYYTVVGGPRPEETISPTPPVPEYTLRPGPDPEPVPKPKPQRRNEGGTRSQVPRGSQSRRGEAGAAAAGAAPIAANLGTLPMIVICGHCGKQVETLVAKRPSACAWISCLVIGMLFTSICCFLPFCMDSCKNTDHICPHCDEYLGTHKAEC